MFVPIRESAVCAGGGSGVLLRNQELKRGTPADLTSLSVKAKAGAERVRGVASLTLFFSGWSAEAKIGFDLAGTKQ